MEACPLIVVVDFVKESVRTSGTHCPTRDRVPPMSRNSYAGSRLLLNFYVDHRAYTIKGEIKQLIALVSMPGCELAK